jgi:hypothetical protein
MDDSCCAYDLVVTIFLQVSCTIVLGTGVLASVMLRHVPPFGASAPSTLSLLTCAQKSYVGR